MDTKPLQARLEWAKFRELTPETTRALVAIGQAVKSSGLEPNLVELVKLRASQINGCAFCVNMHANDLRELGETEARLQLLCAWHEAPVFTPRERAALAWTEALTLVTEGHVPDAVYESVREHFSETELGYLTSAVVAINAWNRIAIAYRFAPVLKGAQ